MLSMSLYQDILEKTAENDVRWAGMNGGDLLGSVYGFPVPKNHPRSAAMQSYSVEVRDIRSTDLQADLFIVDQGLSRHPVLSGLDDDRSSHRIVYLPAQERDTKDIDKLSQLLSEIHGAKSVIGIGGGIILNATGYLAEQMNAELNYIPSTPISMSDSAIGGKVRANKIDGEVFHKHAYKSFFEPNRIIVDRRFLTTLSTSNQKIGFAEIAKHALYQSKGLLTFLLSDSFSFSDPNAVLKAICWTIDLKRICLDVDPDESEDGSKQVLRAAHNLSDKLEEKSGFQLSHGEAVFTAMKQEAKAGRGAEPSSLRALYQKLNVA